MHHDPQRSARPDMSLIIRPARPGDEPLVLAFIRALAEYEKLLHECIATEADLTRSLFGPRPEAEVLLAFDDEEPAGFALFCHNYSTFLARKGLWLEDLFVHPEYRGRGIGLALLARLARIAVERECGRMEWWVLDWNRSAIGFYRKLGARPMDEWTVFRLTGDALTRLASEGTTSD
jgi:GNAT superfamily N-acetyltransferase